MAVTAHSQSDPCSDSASATPVGGLTLRASFARARMPIVDSATGFNGCLYVRKTQ